MLDYVLQTERSAMPQNPMKNPNDKALFQHRIQDYMDFL